MYQPLADALRPATLDDVCGQEHILGENGLLRRIILSGQVPNMIFYGPSGTGKTTVANLIAARTQRKLCRLNATTASSGDIKEIYSQLDTFMAPNGVLLYLDEIQYFNKKQQQTLLEYIENGKITLIASTTENPYFYIYNAILSRSSVFEFKPISPAGVRKAIARAVCYLEQKNGVTADAEPGVWEHVASACGGDIRKAMSLVSIAFYQKAYRNFRVVGLTGTKGKTTTTYFMKNILDAFCRRNPQLCAAQKSAVLSTVEVDTGIEHHEAHLTTPESPDLQRYFAQTRDSGLPFLTMEVSSQAYKLSRVYGMDFDVGMFLNIGEDHIGPLEHTDFEDYFSCKLQLMEHCRTAIVNREMDHAQRVLEHARAHAQRVLTFGKLETADLDDDDCWILRDIQKEEQGFTFTTSHGLEQDSWRIRMAGRFNVENALAAILAAKALGVDDQSIREGLLQNEVQGRMNLFEKDGVTVLVDYAHNFLSFQKLYESLKADYPGQRIVVVVGCPGGNCAVGTSVPFRDRMRTTCI